MWKNFLATFLLQSLRYAFSRSREKRSASGSTLSVPAKDPFPKAVNPEESLPVGVVTYLGKSYSALEKAPIDFELMPRHEFDWAVQLSFDSIEFIHVSLQKGDRSLCDALGITPENFASTLRNAGVFRNPSESSSKESSDKPGQSPAVHDDRDDWETRPSEYL